MVELRLLPRTMRLLMILRFGAFCRKSCICSRLVLPCSWTILIDKVWQSSTMAEALFK
jgi:hypothetical protein